MREPELVALFGLAWGRIQAAPERRNAPFRTPVLCTAGQSGPAGRVVVLRAVDRALNRLEIHTDHRSAKVAELLAASRLSLLFWDTRHQFQVRAEGEAGILAHGPYRDGVYAGLSERQKTAYHLPLPPGTPVETRAASKQAAEPTDPAAIAGGAGHFTVILATLDRLDCLTLARDGHERAIFERQGTEWTGSWVAP